MNEQAVNNSTPLKRLPLVLLLLLALAVGLLAGLWVQRGGVTIEDIKATVLEPPNSIENFELVTHLGTPFTLDSLKGKWSLLFFGYTNCPDVCPTTLQTLTQVDKQIGEDVTDDHQMQVVFVSVDPERDSLERLAQYVPYFNQSFIGVTGKQTEINRLTQQLGILHMRVESDDDQSYLVDHTSSILLFNPNGELRALFSVPHKAKDIAEDVLKIKQI
ncbi:MAG: SCO family protein [Arenicellales bacterium]|nr:SCO family protein [Arenicellales bacterium]